MIKEEILVHLESLCSCFEIILHQKVCILLESVGAFIKLKELDLSQTKISILHDAIHALENLDGLSLSQTKVSMLLD